MPVSGGAPAFPCMSPPVLYFCLSIRCQSYHFMAILRSRLTTAWYVISQTSCGAAAQDYRRDPWAVDYEEPPAYPEGPSIKNGATGLKSRMMGMASDGLRPALML